MLHAHTREVLPCQPSSASLMPHPPFPCRFLLRPDPPAACPTEERGRDTPRFAGGCRSIERRSLPNAPNATGGIRSKVHLVVDASGAVRRSADRPVKARGDEPLHLLAVGVREGQRQVAWSQTCISPTRERCPSQRWFLDAAGLAILDRLDATVGARERYGRCPNAP